MYILNKVFMGSLIGRNYSWSYSHPVYAIGWVADLSEAPL